MIKKIIANKAEIINAAGKDIYRLFVVAAIAFYIVLFAAFVLCFTANSHAAENTRAKSNKAVIREYVKQHYKGYKTVIKPAESITDKTLANRRGKKIIFVEYYKTISRGKYGKVIKRGPFYGNKINYAEPVKRGKITYVYLIYNPNDNSFDSILAAVNNGSIKVF